jgi:hypothetical protein
MIIKRGTPSMEVAMHTAAEEPTSAHPLGGDLKAVLGRAHEEARALLADPDASRLDVVSWLSAHVAAFEHAVYSVAKHRLPNGTALLNEDRDVVSRLTHVLRIAERVHSGDVLASNLSAESLQERLVELVDEHSAVQRQIVDGLDRALDLAESASLTHDYEVALAHAPTRPHPHLRSRVLYRLDAMRDHILDTMDGRHVPFPRMPKARIVPGRWGSYLLGQQHEPDEMEEPPH